MNITELEYLQQVTGIDKLSLHDDYNYPDTKQRISYWDSGKSVKSITFNKTAKLDTIINLLTKERTYTNLKPTFERLGLNGRIYYTSFGFSYDLFLVRNDKFADDTNKLKQSLDNMGIVYRCEYSEAYWVYRFRISQSKENLAKII